MLGFIKAKVTPISQIVGFTMVGLQIIEPMTYDIVLGCMIMGVMFIATRIKK